ncbi:MAG: hypothetical protein NVS4B3_06880 [Gemmatimonadaceae bacterium]
MTARLPRSVAAYMLAATTLARATAASAQSSLDRHASPSPIAGAQARSGPITIDGRLDEGAWAAVTPITTFRQLAPVEGAPATQRTEIRILYDDEALYVGARMYDSLGARGVHAPLARRDQLLDSHGNNGSFNALTTDKLAIVLDPYHNHLDGVRFEINPAGARGDAINGDASYDPIWEAAAHIDSLGWTAEMRIPFSQLRFSRDTAQIWGLQIWRYVDRLNEQDMWSFWRRNEAGGPSRFGHLTGITLRDRPRQLEVVPYVVSRAQFKHASSADPYHRSNEMLGRVGGDAKYLLTSNLTLDATVNPDFGQVEVDPATVNLSAFETFYQEKRPFFVAGRGSFDFGEFNCMFCDNVSNLDLFYSRRIGRAPQLNGDVSDRSTYADLPENTTILGAAKLTGRTANGYSVGMLDALTGRATARFLPSGMPTGTQADQEVEPLTNYLVGRVKRELRDGATTVGAIVTSTARRLDDSLLATHLRGAARVGGIDLHHSWSQRTYSILGQFAVSDVAGSDSAIARTEQSSARYFQRPDRQTVSDGLFDARYRPGETALRGYGLYARVAKDNGDWVWETAQNWRSPGFEVNDLAFLHRADYKWMLANVGRQWSTPTRRYRNLALVAGVQNQLNYDGNQTDGEVHGGVFGQLTNYWGFGLVAIHRLTTLDDGLTRGGPIVKRAGYDFLGGNLSTDARRTAVFGVNLQSAHGNDVPNRFLSVSPSVTVKPASNVLVSFSPRFDTSEDAQQYVTTVDDPRVTAFYGKRYVFAFLRQRALSFDTRVNVTFTPNFTLELFTQPFFSTGDYSRFREFAAPRTITMLEYGRDAGSITYTGPTAAADGFYTVDPGGPAPARPFTLADPNFSFRSLRGNAVLRWEYRPGSTLFFVWTQQRSGSDALGTFDLGRERSALFRDRPTNIFQVKMNYWIGR